jgi:hypothetical protein
LAGLASVVVGTRAPRLRQPDDDATPTITPKHLQALGKLRFAWHMAIESGGPIVDRQRECGG